jgi:hypothetical protein
VIKAAAWCDFAPHRLSRGWTREHPTKVKNWLELATHLQRSLGEQALQGLKNNELLFSTGLRLTFGKRVF